MQIALWNASGIDSFGDRLLDFINRRELKKRINHASFDTYCPWPSINAPEGYRSNPLVIKNDGSWSGLGKYNAIVIGGGAIINGPPFAHPGSQTFFLGANPSLFKDEVPIAWNAVCSDGQFAAGINSDFSKYVQESTNKLGYCSVRNERTATFLEECNVTQEIKIVPDPAVLLIDASNHKTSGSPNKKKPKVGLVVSRPVFPKAFLEEMEQFAFDYLKDSGDKMSKNLFAHQLIHLKDHGKNDYNDDQFIDMFINALGNDFLQHVDLSIGVSNSKVYCDYALTSLFSNKINHKYTVFNDPIGQDVLTWIQGLDCLIASRFHLCTLALSAGTPVVALDLYNNPIIGTNKLKELMKTFKRIDDYFTIDQFLANDLSLYTCVEKAIAHKDSLPEIHKNLWVKSNEHFDQLADFISTK